jgi:hypothetical protein
MQACGGSEERAAGATAWLASRDVASLGNEVAAGSGSVTVLLDGQKLVLRQGEHFDLPGGGSTAGRSSKRVGDVPNGTV